MKAGPLCEKSMALKGRPGPKHKDNSYGPHFKLDWDHLESVYWYLIRVYEEWPFTQQCVSNWVVMLPHEEIVDWDVGDLWLGSIGSQQSQPVLCRYHIVGVDSVLGQFQGI